MSIDRSDILYVVQEVSRHMSDPGPDDWVALKRLARYLIYRPMIVHTCRKQQSPKDIVVWVNTDLAGCTHTRKFTSGAVLMFGSAGIRSWSRTQKRIALFVGRG